VLVDGRKVYLYPLDLSAGSQRADVQDLLSAGYDVHEVYVVKLVGLSPLGVHGAVVVEGEAVKPEDISHSAGGRARRDGQDIPLALEGAFLQGLSHGVLEHLHHCLVNAEDHVTLEHIVGRLRDVVSDVAHAVGGNGGDVRRMHAGL